MKIISSGSKGNCYQFTKNGKSFLVDCGVSEFKVSNPPEFILYTHKHSDHYKGSFPTVESYSPDIPGTTFLKPDQAYSIHDVKVVTMDATHDASCLNYYIDTGSERALIITDTAFVPKLAEKLAAKSDIILIESNYTLELLKESHYPEFLKDRIIETHLETEQTLSFCRKFRDKKIILIHVSENSQSVEFLDVSMKRIGVKQFHIVPNGRSFDTIFL